ncbi:MAG: phosphoenolpyruvate synthase regulatory protein [gamma proteobacterium symbiont of Ctena orbiculata]|uniref:Putative phosphoenolpyruvate synthase regulatory protein n=1 Tax=Candidatus Thiodiazotropha taylori TaxID=2792791 RepID=A0A944MB47_9GAMM|nr:kinase/pyrophosphorylase [Candidatus Thiodiazotropha taylori]PUB85732.1 MAG: phosphoenolpyruvate synthase regulatory protein [gamma proteobacterium symbiont of Ctena orbiculata]MBT2988167.1 kinase/pyrophosphorylase [Candidatus Thiodiazotropha taylori]MBT2996065.1 kinase/pyrophosphorylase [Candidatus Thiodiazotropha taylori]MBT2999791.1 kinase/pyrophosphorylase [Candidatus Thiodiazotropha taylori]
MKRTIFFLADHTGITVEAMGRSLLSQFEGFSYETVHWPFIDSLDKARRVAERINQTTMESEQKPIVFTTLVDPQIRDYFKQLDVPVMDFFETFTSRLEDELQLPSSHALGRFHTTDNNRAYDQRIHAVNFALNNDDGAVTKNYTTADLILIGVSRVGKTPTCLFLGLQHSVLAANYPLTDDDLNNDLLPKPLRTYKDKLYGLTIDPQQLQRIRQERRPDRRYSTLEQCKLEIKMAEDLFKHYKIPYLDTTSMSIEEISARLLQHINRAAKVSND